MDALECIKTRQSIREFKEKPVEFDKITTIIEAGKSAPSAGNLQDWKFILITEESTKKKISDACEQQVWMDNAPVHIIVCSEPEKTQRMYGKRGQENYSIQNASAAVENMLLSAHAQGLGACWIGAFNEEKLRETANIPEEIIPRAVIPIGYPAQKNEQQKKLSVIDVTYIEKWNNRIKDIAAYELNYYKKVQEYKEKAEKIIEKLKNVVKR